MNLVQSFHISGSGLSAQRLKLNVISENLANVDTTRTEDGGPWRRKMVVLEERDVEGIETNLEAYKKKQEQKGVAFKSVLDAIRKEEEGSSGLGVEATRIVKSQEDFRLVYQPNHPDADPLTGYVAMPNVDPMTEVADMMVAKRAYEANVTAMNNTKAMMMKALEIGK